MPRLMALLCVLAAFSAQAASNAILELSCSYPDGGSGGVSVASAEFTSSDRTESVSVVYTLTTAALQKELSTRSSMQYAKVSDDHYASKGGAVTLRNIEKRPGLIDNACDEAISILVAKFDQRDPDDFLRIPSTELYLLEGLSRHRWDLVSKQFRDRSTPSHVKTSATYYLRRPD